MAMQKNALVLVLACLAVAGNSKRVQNPRMMEGNAKDANIGTEVAPETKKALATSLFNVNPAVTLAKQNVAVGAVLPHPPASNTVREQNAQPFEESQFTQPTYPQFSFPDLQTNPQFSFPHLQQDSTSSRTSDTTMSYALMAQRVCPLLGVFLSTWLYFSPIPTIRKCVEKQSLGSFNPFPSFLMLIGASAWFGYGLSAQDVYISITNVFGTLLALAQLVFILPLMRPGRQLSQAQGIVLGGAACTMFLWFRIIFGGVSMMARSQALGIYATAICIMLFASPLFTLTTVFKNRDSSTILAPLALSQTFNCLMWFIYGAFASKDIFVYGPNGIGLVLGLAQLALKAAFPSQEDTSDANNLSATKDVDSTTTNRPSPQMVSYFPRGRTASPQMVATAQPKTKPVTQGECSWNKFTSKWEIHKFGGASLETAELYKTCGDLLLSQAAAKGPETRVPTAAIVSACGGMTDALVAVVEASVDDFDKATELLKAAADRQKGILLEAVPGRPEITDPVIKNLDADQKGVLAMLTASSMMRGAPPQMLELVAGLGEVWSAQTLSAYLNFAGVKSEWVDARDVLIVGESGMAGLGEKGQALDTITPEWDVTCSHLQAWWEKEIGDANKDQAPFLIITGFVCSTPSGRPTTLKRSGSDYSATIFAKVLEASRVTMWKNVNGVYTADPRRVPAAFSVKDMTFDEAMELAYFGGQVLHPTAMVPCIEKRIPVYVKNVFNPTHPGTCVYGRGDDAFRWEDQAPQEINPKVPVTAITSIEKVSLITIAGTSFLGTPGVARRMMEALGSAGVNVILASQGSSEASITVAVDASDGQRGVTLVQQAFELELARNDEARCFLVEDMSILAIIGEGMKTTPGIAGRFFRALGLAKVNVVAIAQGSSERNVSAVVARAELSRALRAVHSGVALSEMQVAVGVIGAGRVATGLLSQLNRFQATDAADIAVPAMKAISDLSFDIRTICDSKRMVTKDMIPLEAIMKSEKDLSALDWTELFGDEDVQDVDYDKMTEYFDSDEFPHKVIIDCTDSDSVPDMYSKWLERGIHVISANKNGGAGPLPRWKQCFNHRAQWLYEAAAGSQLPVISLIRDMFQTGDRIDAVSGVLSGTLSFLFTTLASNPGMAFSDAVQLAVDKNLTEFSCEQDLSGKDTARKALIIARELGLELELEDVTIESLLPASIAAGQSNEDIIKVLREQVDEQMGAKLKASQDNGERLLYVAEIDVQKQTVWVGLKSFNEGKMPFVVREAETAITFVTERNPASTPFVLRAPGAGSEVTATGAFADLLRLSKNLRA